MKEFVRVVPLAEAERLAIDFPPVGTERIALGDALGRVVAAPIEAPEALPPFSRATMDGYAVIASATFGASEASPALLSLVSDVAMGERPTAPLARGQAARIATGGVLPPGADAVVMIEHSEPAGAGQLEVVRSVAPGDNVLRAGEDAERAQEVVARGTRLRPQELGLLAALGIPTIEVHRRPTVAILSTGDELVPFDATPTGGQIRDVNATSLAALVQTAGGVPIGRGIVRDDFSALATAAGEALESSDALLISGGSSVGAHDYTEQVLRSLPAATLLVQGVALRPGKPTLLARAGHKPVWGLPGQVTSAMVVFELLVRPCLEQLGGAVRARRAPWPLRARLTRNVPSVHGRTDLVRVRLERRDGGLFATPVLGPSGLLRTMVEADGLLTVEQDVEGLYENDEVWVTLV